MAVIAANPKQYRRPIGPQDPRGHILACPDCGGTGMKPPRPAGWLVPECNRCFGSGKLLLQDGKLRSAHRLCMHEMRGWGHGIVRYCNLDKDHKGKRHCSVAWCCDACGRMQRGQVYDYGRDGEYEHGMALCFMCASPQLNDRHGLGWNPY